MFEDIIFSKLLKKLNIFLGEELFTSASAYSRPGKLNHD